MSGNTVKQQNTNDDVIKQVDDAIGQRKRDIARVDAEIAKKRQDLAYKIADEKCIKAFGDAARAEPDFQKKQVIGGQYFQYKAKTAQDPFTRGQCDAVIPGTADFVPQVSSAEPAKKKPAPKATKQKSGFELEPTSDLAAEKPAVAAVSLEQLAKQVGAGVNAVLASSHEILPATVKSSASMVKVA